jgi:RND family efflux transporter MFP subunit
MTRSSTLGRALRVGLFVLLFGGLVAVLLGFQGLLFHRQPAGHPISEPPALDSRDRTARVEARRIPAFEAYPGQVEALDAAPLAPRVMAQVCAVGKREGEAFAAGEVLAVLDDADAQARLRTAQAVLAQAEAEATRAAQERARAERLAAAQAFTERELEAAVAADAAAAAAVARAQGSLVEAATALSWYRLHVPFAGRVLTRHVDPGALAFPGQPVLTLYRPDDLRVRVAVPEGRAAGLEPGTELPVAVAGSAMTATMDRVLPDADPRTGTVVLRLALTTGAASHALVRPGAFARLQLPVGERTALLIPAAAVRRVGQLETVALVQDGRVVPATVRTGPGHGELVEVLSGLAAGDEVKLP